MNLIGPDENDPIPVTGVLKGNKLAPAMHPQLCRNVALDPCELTVDGDQMTGPIDGYKGLADAPGARPSRP